MVEYALDAICELDATPAGFTEADRAWVVRREAASFADIEVATLRFVARNASNVHRAAARVGLSHAALRDWFLRRGPAK